MVWLPDADGLPVERGAVRMVKAEVKAEARGDWARETCDCVLGAAPGPKQAQRPGRAPAPSHAPAPRRRRAALVALARMRSGVSDDEAGAGSGDDSGADSDAGGKDVTDGDDSDGADTRLARRERRARAGTCAGGGTGQPRPAATREQPAAGARSRAAGLLCMVEGCWRGGAGAGGTSRGIPRGWQAVCSWLASIPAGQCATSRCVCRQACERKRVQCPLRPHCACANRRRRGRRGAPRVPAALPREEGAPAVHAHRALRRAQGQRRPPPARQGPLRQGVGAGRVPRRAGLTRSAPACSAHCVRPCPSGWAARVGEGLIAGCRRPLSAVLARTAQRACWLNRAAQVQQNFDTRGAHGRYGCLSAASAEFIVPCQQQGRPPGFFGGRTPCSFAGDAQRRLGLFM